MLQLSSDFDMRDFERARRGDDEANQKNAHLREEQDKRLKQKKEDEAAMRRDWFEHVGVFYVVFAS